MLLNLFVGKKRAQNTTFTRQKFTWNSRETQKCFLNLTLPAAPSDLDPGLPSRMHGLLALLRCGGAKAGFWPALTKTLFFFFFYKQYKECARYAVMPVCQVNRGCPHNRGVCPNFWHENAFTAFFSRRNPSLSSPVLQDLLQRLRWYNPHL